MGAIHVNVCCERASNQGIGGKYQTGKGRVLDKRAGAIPAMGVGFACINAALPFMMAKLAVGSDHERPVKRKTFAPTQTVVGNGCVRLSDHRTETSSRLDRK